MKDSVPLYQRLKSQILAEIQSGKWQAGELLPSEGAMAERFGVSRTTVRQAIGDLVSSGYVTRQQGKGTFVSHRSSTMTASVLYGFAEELRQRGLAVKLFIESVEVGPCSEEASAYLQTPPSTPVIRIARTGFVANQCMFHEVSHLILPSQSDLRELTKTTEAFDNIYGFLERYGVKIALGKQFIRAEQATIEDMRVFDVTENEAMLVVFRVTQEQSGAAVEFSQVRYPGRLYDFEVQLLRNVNQ